MASKNPVKGYIRCHMPNCGCIATVHAVGEHKALTEGQPPRNKRNMGRLYFQCPEHGFQQGKGKDFQDFIQTNMNESREALKDAACEPESKPLTKPLVKPLDKPAKTEPETPPKPAPTKLEAAKPYLVALFALLTFFLIVNTRKKANDNT